MLDSYSRDDGDRTRDLLIRPEASVLAMSGFNEREAKQRFGTFVGYVQKPFTAGHLSGTISSFNECESGCVGRCRAESTFCLQLSPVGQRLFVA